MYLKIRNESGVKLSKADKLRNIMDEFWSWPCLKEHVFRLCRPITVRAHVDTNKFKAFWEEVALAKSQ